MVWYNCRLAAAAVSFLKFWLGLFWAFVYRAKAKDDHKPNDKAQRNWEADWQDFSVSVIPNAGGEGRVPSACNDDNAHQCDVVNVVLNEMQPVLKRTKTVHLVVRWYSH